MPEWYRVDLSEAERLMERIDEYGPGSGRVVDGVLHGEGADMIKRAIPPLIRPSGRKWAGKAQSIAGRASGGSRLSQDDGMLSVTVAARGRLGYLYFPDDGANTKRHRGGQEFMRRGAMSMQSDILDRCIAGLVEEFERD